MYVWLVHCFRYTWKHFLVILTRHLIRHELLQLILLVANERNFKFKPIEIIMFNRTLFGINFFFFIYCSYQIYCCVDYKNVTVEYSVKYDHGFDIPPVCNFENTIQSESKTNRFRQKFEKLFPEKSRSTWQIRFNRKENLSTIVESAFPLPGIANRRINRRITIPIW